MRSLAHLVEDLLRVRVRTHAHIEHAQVMSQATRELARLKETPKGYIVFRI